MCLPVHPYKIEREWEHAGLKCAVVQAREAQNRCGYVRVPPGHPLHGKHYDAVDVSVHGGLTFADVEPCEHEDGAGWWFGFDCAHLGDAFYDPNPNWNELSNDAQHFLTTMESIHRDVSHKFGFSRPPEHFWTQAEVETETERLAEQLAIIDMKQDIDNVVKRLKSKVKR